MPEPREDTPENQGSSERPQSNWTERARVLACAAAPGDLRAPRPWLWSGSHLELPHRIWSLKEQQLGKSKSEGAPREERRKLKQGAVQTQALRAAGPAACSADLRARSSRPGRFHRAVSTGGQGLERYASERDLAKQHLEQF